MLVILFTFKFVELFVLSADEQTGLGCNGGGLDTLRSFFGRGGRAGWDNCGFGFKTGGKLVLSGIISWCSSSSFTDAFLVNNEDDVEV